MDPYPIDYPPHTMPPRFPKALEAWYKKQYRHVTTRRGIQDIYYRDRAKNMLSPREEEYRSAKAFIWLFEPEKPSILTELGRLEFEDNMAWIAAELCRRKPTTKEAIRLVKQWGSRKRLRADTERLAVKLLDLFDRHCVEWPDTTKHHLVKAQLIAGCWIGNRQYEQLKREAQEQEARNERRPHHAANFLTPSATVQVNNCDTHSRP